MTDQNILLQENGYPNAPAEQKPALRLSAYYYDFDATGVYAVDLVLSAVAMAGRSAHHTDLWDESAGSRDGVDGDTPVEWIQSAAQKAAAHIEQLEREMDKIKRVAACGTVDSFIALPDQDKRYWFAICVEESAWRKELHGKVSDLECKLADALKDSDRLRWLHSINEDAEGYEYGVAKVKFTPDGKLESFLWTLSDHSDIDAAMKDKP